MIAYWKNLVQHVGTKYEQEIRNKKNNNIKVNIVTPEHSTQVLVRHATQEALIHTGQSNIQSDCWTKSNILRKAVSAEPADTDLIMKIAILDNEISKGDYDLSNKITVEMLGSEKTAHGNHWCTY